MALIKNTKGLRVEQASSVYSRFFEINKGKKGFIIPLALIIIAALFIGGGAYYYISTKQSLEIKDDVQNDKNGGIEVDHNLEIPKETQEVAQKRILPSTSPIQPTPQIVNSTSVNCGTVDKTHLVGLVGLIPGDHPSLLANETESLNCITKAILACSPAYIIYDSKETDEKGQPILFKNQVLQKTSNSCSITSLEKSYNTNTNKVCDFPLSYLSHLIPEIKSYGKSELFLPVFLNFIFGSGVSTRGVIEIKVEDYVTRENLTIPCKEISPLSF